MDLKKYISILEKIYGIHVSGIKNEKAFIDKVKAMVRNSRSFSNLNWKGILDSHANKRNDKYPPIKSCVEDIWFG